MNFQKLGLLFLIVTLSSCISLKKTIYMQDSDSTATTGKMPDFVLKIYPNDILSIQVFTINTEAFPGIASTIDKQLIDNRSAYEKGFVLGKDGFIELPLIGKINIAGMTIAEARDSLVNRFEKYMDAPIVVIKKLSFKITILGEVNKPGLYYIPNEKISMLEGLGMAGDLTTYGNRKEIKIVRQSPDGYKEIMLDITTKDILNSEVAYLHPDDVVYVAPVRRRSVTTVSPTVAVVTSIIATLTILISVILREN
jgi:polysaccharide export outer membrane protein